MPFKIFYGKNLTTVKELPEYKDTKERMLKMKTLETIAKYGAGDRNRTYDPLITKELIKINEMGFLPSLIDLLRL